MTTVRIIKDWSTPDIFRQTPGCTGVWDGIRFHEEDLASDYVIVLNTPLEKTRVDCAPANLWLMIQEPPNEEVGWLHNGGSQYARIYTTDPTRKGRGVIHSQTALPWHVGKDYDSLKAMGPAEKTGSLSWITSSKNDTSGHRVRMKFLERLLERDLPFDLFGRGFTSIGDKWDGLAYHKYSLAIENYPTPYYWTEKISDCFLSWTMPIYYGCTRIAEYFPPESMAKIDIKDPDAPAIVEDIIQSERWKKNIDAIEYARNRVLDEYQIFPFLRNEIVQHRDRNALNSHAKSWILQPTEQPVSTITKLKNKLGRSKLYQFVREIYRNAASRRPRS